MTPTTVATARALARGEREPLDRAERLAALATRGGVLAPGRLPETPAARTLTTTRAEETKQTDPRRGVLQNVSSTDATPTRARTTTSKPTPTPRHARTNASSANETPPRPRVTADGSPRMTSRRRRPRRRRPPRPTGAAEPRPRRRRSDDSPRRPRRRLRGEYSTPIRRRGRRGRIERCEARKGSTVSRFPKSRSRHRRRRLACRDPCVPRRRAPRRNRSTAARERDRRLLARHSTASARRSPSRKRARRAVERSERSSRRLVSRRRVPRDAPPKEDASEEDGPPTRRLRRRNRRGWNVSTRSRAARARDSTRSPAHAETYRRQIRLGIRSLTGTVPVAGARARSQTPPRREFPRRRFARGRRRRRRRKREVLDGARERRRDEKVLGPVRVLGLGRERERRSGFERARPNTRARGFVFDVERTRRRIRPFARVAARVARKPIRKPSARLDLSAVFDEGEIPEGYRVYQGLPATPKSSRRFDRRVDHPSSDEFVEAVEERTAARTTTTPSFSSSSSASPEPGFERSDRSPRNTPNASKLRVGRVRARRRRGGGGARTRRRRGDGRRRRRRRAEVSAARLRAAKIRNGAGVAGDGRRGRKREGEGESGDGAGVATAGVHRRRVLGFDGGDENDENDDDKENAKSSAWLKSDPSVDASSRRSPVSGGVVGRHDVDSDSARSNARRASPATPPPTSISAALRSLPDFETVCQKTPGGDETRVGRIRARVAATSKFLQRERGRGRGRRRKRQPRAGRAAREWEHADAVRIPIPIPAAATKKRGSSAALEKLVSATADDAETETRPNANAWMDEPVVTVRDA